MGRMIRGFAGIFLRFDNIKFSSPLFLEKEPNTNFCDTNYPYNAPNVHLYVRRYRI